MILRRIMLHLRKQEWTAVGIDLVIVVLGVFLGLEASNWNTEREDRRLEHEYLVRLHGELADTVSQDAALSSSLTESATHLQEVSDYLLGDARGFAASPDQCFAVFRANIFSGSVTLPPTLEELISTGRIVLVSDSDLRASLLGFAHSADQQGQLRSDLQNGRVSLAHEYPELIRLRPDALKGVECDFAAMARSPPFLNDFAENTFRFQAHHAIIQEQQQLRERLHAALDQELGFRHDEAVMQAD